MSDECHCSLPCSLTCLLSIPLLLSSHPCSTPQAVAHEAGAGGVFHCHGPPWSLWWSPPCSLSPLPPPHHLCSIVPPFHCPSPFPLSPPLFGFFVVVSLLFFCGSVVLCCASLHGWCGHCSPPLLSPHSHCCCSTRDPPHEQLLMRLGVGGIWSFIIVVVSLPCSSLFIVVVIVIFPPPACCSSIVGFGVSSCHWTIHSPPCKQLLAVVGAGAGCQVPSSSSLSCLSSPPSGLWFIIEHPQSTL